MKTIFAHGLGQNSSSWDKIICNLAICENIICPDLPLFTVGKECTYENLYRYFSNYCVKNSDSLNLCGLSLGAVLALNFAIENPQKVSSLILIAPQCKMPKKLLKLQNAVFRFMPDSAFKEIGFDKKDFIKLTNSMINLDFSENLINISCPVLVMCGENDKANRAASEKIAASIPNAEFKYIKNSGHEVNMDAPERLVEAVNCFYKKHGAGII